jgi:hypothetical protein
MLADVDTWARNEFGSVDLGDIRRNKRAVKAARALAVHCKGTLPQSFENWYDLKATYNLLSNPDVTYEELIKGHCQRTCEAVHGQGDYLVVQDTTILDFSSHRQMKGTGRIGDDNGRGLMVHTTLGLRIMHWQNDSPIVEVAGLCDQQCWARPEKQGPETRRERLQRPRESQRWAQALRHIGNIPPAARCTHVADRESDIFELFMACGELSMDYIVRANQRRALADSDQSVFDIVAHAPVSGHYTLDLRARPGQRARRATIAVRTCSATLRGPYRPDEKLPPLSVNIVQALEENPPADAQPVHWVLLTSWPISSFCEVRRIIMSYGRRWLIEEYHKALKTGVGIENSELSTARQVRNLLGILAILAARLLSFKLLALQDPDGPLHYDELTKSVIELLEKRYGPPKTGWTNRALLVSIARMGGFIGRKSDGNPGWLTIWRGIQKLLPMLDGYLLAQGKKFG